MIQFKKSTKNNVKFIDSDQLYAKFIDKTSLLVKIHDIVDFEHYRPIFEPLYSEYGQHAYDCIFMFKLCLLQELQGSLSDRQVIQQSKTNLEYRYFLGLSIDDPLPHFTKLGTFRDRLGKKKFDELFSAFVQVLRDNHIITDDELRLMDATHQLADTSIVSITTLLAQACKHVIKCLEKYESYTSVIDLDKKDFLLSDQEKKNRFVSLVKLANDLQDKIKKEHNYETNDDLAESLKILSRIVKERSTVIDDDIRREDSDDTSKLASVTDKDATWGSKSKDYQFLGYKHNVTSTESGFIEVISTHQGHETDDSFYLEDAKESTGEKIVTDGMYGTLDNRMESEKLGKKLVAPHRKNMKAHLEHKIMDDVLFYNKTRQYKEEMKKRGAISEGIFGQMKKFHGFARAKWRGLEKVSRQGLIVAFVLNLKKLIKCFDVATAT